MAAAAKEYKCGLCHRGEEVSDVCGKLWTVDTHDGVVAAHHKCMQYSALLIQYKIDTFGGFKVHKVQEEIKRGSRLKCSICTKGKDRPKGRSNCNGATAGCAIKRCSKTFHFYCAATNEKSVTKRMELHRTDTNKKMVQYSVFCSVDHLKKHEAMLKKEQQDIKYVSDSDDESGDETDAFKRCTHDTPPSSQHSASALKKPSLIDDDSSSESDFDQPPPKKQKQDEDDEDTDDDDDGNKSITSTGSSGSRTSTSSDGGHSRGKGGGGSSGQKSQGRKDTSSKDSEPRPNGNNGGQSNQNPDGDHKTNSAGNNTKLAGSDLNGNQVCNGVKHKRRSSVQHNGDRSGLGRTLGILTPVKSEKQCQQNGISHLPKGTCIGRSVLCLLEGTSSHPQVESVLQTRAGELYNLHPAAVHCWQCKQHNVLQPKHMIYFFLELSKAVLDGNVSRIRHLVFSPNIADAQLFENQVCTSAFGDWKQNCKEIRKTIQENFVEAKAMHDCEVGRLVREKELDTYVIYLVLDDQIDPKKELRDRLVKGKQHMYKWGQSTMLQYTNNIDQDTRKELQLQEMKTLQKFLGKIVAQMKVLQLPSDPFLLSKTSAISVTHELYQRFEDDGVEDDSMTEQGTLVFIGPVDTDVVNHRACVHRCMEYLLGECLTQRKKVYCVFDIGPQYAMRCTVDMVCSLPSHVCVKLFTGLNPAIDQVTCMLMELEFGTE